MGDFRVCFCCHIKFSLFLQKCSYLLTGWRSGNALGRGRAAEKVSLLYIFDRVYEIQVKVTIFEISGKSEQFSQPMGAISNSKYTTWFKPNQAFICPEHVFVEFGCAMRNLTHGRNAFQINKQRHQSLLLTLLVDHYQQSFVFQTRLPPAENISPRLRNSTYPSLTTH